MEGIQSLIQSMTHGAASGTGILKLLPMTEKMFGGTVPPYLVTYALNQQLAIFGDYPTSSDVAPSAIFTAVFAILFLAHLYIFFKNCSRGHKFWLTLGFAFYCMIRFIGFGMRISWAKDIQRLEVGMASEVFIIIPIVLLASFNLVLAQRIFTWRHPHIGSEWWFWSCMIVVYTVVTGVVVMAILGSLIPYIYFLSEHHYTMCKQVSRAAAILCVLYSVLAASLVIGAFLIKPTPKSDKIWTYQPWWIESFDVFYYVPKGSCRRAEETFAEREPSAGDAVRIIASTTHYHNTLEKVHSVTSKKGTLTHNTSMSIIGLTTVILLLSSVFRCVSTFIDQTHANQSWIYKPVVMYIMFGFLETVINLVYLLGRVDLRFYRPDKLTKGMCGSRHNSTASVDHGEETLRGSQTNSDEDKVKAVAPDSSPELA
jgi:hypothetical protein